MAGTGDGAGEALVADGLCDWKVVGRLDPLLRENLINFDDGPIDLFTVLLNVLKSF
jgi:hypothetical protein